MHEERGDLEGNEKYCDGFISLCLPSMVSRLWQKPVNIWAIPTLRVRFMRWRRNLHQNVNVQTDADSAKYSGRFILLESFLSLGLVTWNYFNLRWAFSRLYVSVVFANMSSSSKMLHTTCRVNRLTTYINLSEVHEGPHTSYCDCWRWPHLSYSEFIVNVCHLVAALGHLAGAAEVLRD